MVYILSTQFKMSCSALTRSVLQCLDWSELKITLFWNWNSVILDLEFIWHSQNSPDALSVKSEQLSFKLSRWSLKYFIFEMVCVPLSIHLRISYYYIAENSLGSNPVVLSHVINCLEVSNNQWWIFLNK